MFEVLHNAVQEGGKVLHAFFRKAQLDITNKTDHHNIVTMADLQSQEAIKQSLIEGMKHKGIGGEDIGFIGEEKLTKKGLHTFIIDPLDGTSNFASGLDLFVTPVAYLLDGVLEAAIIYRPSHDELYFAEKGKGAWVMRNGEKVSLNVVDTAFKNGLLGLESGHARTTKNLFSDTFFEFIKKFRGMRLLGVAALDLAYLAENTFQAVIINKCMIWDIAAAKLILEEAGARLYDFEGKDIVLDLDKEDEPYFVVACHPAQKQQIITALSSV